MVAILSPNKCIQATLNYNENKVKAGVALCLAAENFQCDLASLGFYAKLNYLQKVAAQNSNTKVNCLHAHLNFDPSEYISDEKMQEIALLYMDKLGFGNQPFLVYRHHDAGHPHCHIVTTNIEISGKRIDLHHLGIRKSEPARKEIEQLFGLVRAEDQTQKQIGQQLAKPVIYGQSDSRKAIGNVLAAVLKSYHYTSLPELNAVLNQYHVSASRGAERSRIFQRGGLIYQVLDEQGQPIGVPMKASLFPGKPGLKFLEGRFKNGEVKRLLHKQKTRARVDIALHDPKINSLETLIQALKKQGIHTVLRKNDQGLIYGITFVDHHTKCVFNGSQLGRNYSIKAIRESLGMQKINNPSIIKIAAQASSHGPVSIETDGFVEALFQEELVQDGLPYELKGKRKKRKKKQISNQN